MSFFLLKISKVLVQFIKYLNTPNFKRQTDNQSLRVRMNETS